MGWQFVFANDQLDVAKLALSAKAVDGGQETLVVLRFLCVIQVHAQHGLRRRFGQHVHVVDLVVVLVLVDHSQVRHVSTAAAVVDVADVVVATAVDNGLVATATHVDDVDVAAEAIEAVGGGALVVVAAVVIIVVVADAAVVFKNVTEVIRVGEFFLVVVFLVMLVTVRVLIMIVMMTV